MNPLKNFKTGFISPFQSISVLFSHASLLRLAIIPIILNIVLFMLFFTLLYTKFGYFIGLLISKPHDWYWIFLYYILYGVVLLLIFIIGAFLLFIIGNIIASPFHEKIAERVKHILHGQTNDVGFSFFKEAHRILISQIKKLGLLLGLEAASLLFLLIPVLGFFLSGFISIILIAFQFLNFPCEVERLHFSGYLKSFFQHPSLWIGFGCGVSLLLILPILNLLTLPAGVIGASLIYYKNINKGATL